MKRATFNDDAVLPPHGSAPITTSLHAYRCSFCGAPSDFKTLADYGARCRACFDAYCRAVPKVRPVPRHEVPPGTPNGILWAYALRARHDSGERLTKAQIDSYKAVLKGRELTAGGEL